MQTTKISLSDSLPLTCTRAGTCCHGNVVMLNPWEIHCLAKGKQLSTLAFQKAFCEPNGIQLKFGGKKNRKGKKACGLYTDNFGCSVHDSRPLACRLFPLGRQVQHDAVNYMYQGKDFPCLNGCPDVVQLPNLTVDAYLQGQATEPFETAQDLYLEVMQNLADMAFELLLDTGLASSGDTKTLKTWRKMGQEQPEALGKRFDSFWLGLLLTPSILEATNKSAHFVNQHFQLLQNAIQAKMATLKTNHDFSEASILLMGLALYLATAIGANTEELSNHWVDTAAGFGAKG